MTGLAFYLTFLFLAQLFCGPDLRKHLLKKYTVQVAFGLEMEKNRTEFKTNVKKQMGIIFQSNWLFFKNIKIVEIFFLVSTHIC